MKTQNILSRGLFLAGIALVAGSVMGVAAGEIGSTTGSPNVVDPAVVSQSNPVQLSANAAEILKLARAKISADTMVAFINNSPNSYNLSAGEIVYLTKEGLPERVIKAMLDKPKAPPVAVVSPAPSSSANLNSVTTYVPAPPVYVYAPAPYPYYYDSYPRYFWGPPAVSFSFGFGGRFHGRR